MADPILITCAACGKQMKVPDSVAGKKVRCTGCKGIVPVPAGKGTAVDTRMTTPQAQKKMAAAREDDDDGKNPYGVIETSLAPLCPFCAYELVPADARICLHCGYDMTKRARVESIKVYERTAADFIFWHLPTLGCFLGIIAIVLGLLYYHFWLPEVVLKADDAHKLADDRWGYFELEQVDYTAAIFHWGIEIWLIVLGIFGGWKCLRFACKRLYNDPLPPEKRKLK